MSTKTSIKRIALVAVSALGFGLLSVVPAKAEVIAADITFTKTDTTANTISAPTARGAQITAALSLTTIDGAGLGGDGVPSTAMTIPATFQLLDPNGTDVTSQATFAVASSVSAGVTATVSGATYTLVLASAAAVGDRTFGTMTFTPSMGGRYTLRVTRGATTGVVLVAAAIADVTNDPYLYVSGGGAVVATSGVGTSSATAITGGIAQVRFATGAKSSGQVFNVTSSGVGVIQTAAASTGTPQSTNGIAGTSDYTQGVRVVTSANTDQNEVLVTVASTVAGVQTLTYTAINTTTGAPATVGTVTITWAAASSTLASTVTSKVYFNQSATVLATLANDDTATGVSCVRTAGSKCANLYIELNDSNGAALANAPLSVSITGPGTIGLDASTNPIGDTQVAAIASTGRSLSASAANGVTGGTTGNQAAVMIFSDGTAGKATITVTSGTVTLATKTVIFYGTVAKLTATQNLFIAPATAAGGTLGCGAAGCTWATVAQTPAVYISATDSAGNVVPGLVITMVSDNTNVISSATIAEDNAAAGDGPGYYNAAVTSPAGGTSGASTKVRFRTLLASGAFVTSDDVTFTLGGTIATGTLTLNKSSYAPGEAMVVTRTARDAAGNAVHDGLASPAVAFTKAVGGTVPAAGEFVNGSSATSTSRPSVFAPATSGAFEARATYTNATTLARTQVIATATVGDDASTAAANAASDAALEAIDAANAATDAANLAAEAADAATVAAEEARDAADAATAAVEALATEVASLIAGLKAQITTLANTVAKIAKRVRA